jgi:hypothetical protein
VLLEHIQNLAHITRSTSLWLVCLARFFPFQLCRPKSLAYAA